MATSRPPTKPAGGGFLFACLPILSTGVIDNSGKIPCPNLMVAVRRNSVGDIIAPF